MLKNVPLFGVGVAGRSPNVSIQKRENLYVEMPADAEANGIVILPTPGLTTFVNFGANPCRGAYSKDNLKYEVNGSTLWEVAANGAMTSRGTLATTGGRVELVDNGTQMLIVDGTTTVYVYTFATLALAQVVVSIAVDTCAFINGYFLAQGTSGQCIFSAPYNGASWSALDVFTAESNPDNLVRVFVDGGTIQLFGTFTTEFWGDSGALDLPFARIGSSAVEWGLAARWSLCKFDGALVFLARNRLGAVQVYMLRGMTAQPVSNEDLDYQLSTYTAVENATAYSYMVGGHPMYCINFPTPNVSWEFDGKTNEWHRRSSGANSARHRGEIQVNYLNKSYVTDWENGKVYLIDQTAFTDDGATIVREFVTRHNKTGNYSRIPQLWLEMEAGTGLVSGQGSDPKVMLTISRDGGHVFGAEVTRTFGKIGKYTWRAVWNALGRARDWVFKFRVTDPVKTVFVAGWARVEE